MSLLTVGHLITPKRPRFFKQIIQFGGIIQRSLLSKFDSFQKQKLIPILHSSWVDDCGRSHYSGEGSHCSSVVDEAVVSNMGVLGVTVLDKGSLLDMLVAHLHASRGFDWAAGFATILCPSKD